MPGPYRATADRYAPQQVTKLRGAGPALLTALPPPIHTLVSSYRPPDPSHLPGMSPPWDALQTPQTPATKAQWLPVTYLADSCPHLPKPVHMPCLPAICSHSPRMLHPAHVPPAPQTRVPPSLDPLPSPPPPLLTQIPQQPPNSTSWPPPPAPALQFPVYTAAKERTMKSR